MKTSSSRTISGYSLFRALSAPSSTIRSRPFSRYSTVSFYPDFDGDLIYNGAASRVFRSDWGNGVQVDTTYRAFATHTFRLGGFFDSERAEIDNHEATFPIDQVTGIPSTVPISIVDNKALQTWIYSVYAQDEWKPVEKLTINYGVRFRPLRRPDARRPGEPAGRRGVQSLQGHHAPRRLCPLFHAATDRTRNGRVDSEIRDHYRRAGFAWQRQSDGRARPLFRCRGNAADNSRTQRWDRLVLQEGGAT